METRAGCCDANSGMRTLLSVAEQSNAGSAGHIVWKPGRRFHMIVCLAEFDRERASTVVCKLHPPSLLLGVHAAHMLPSSRQSTGKAL